MKRFAVILSGCGFEDGSEITEAVSALIGLSEIGSEVEVFAPEMDLIAKNHLTSEVSDTRNLRAEAARISRGDCKDIKNLDTKLFDGLVIPGGFGAALNLSTWALKGAECDVNDDVRSVISQFHADSKPILAMCIAPAVVAKVLGSFQVALTIGQDQETAAEINKTGATHVNCAVTDFVSDRENKLVTTPAYMYSDAKAFDVYTGIRKALLEFAEMA